jgi:hypothetical protein
MVLDKALGKNKNIYSTKDANFFDRLGNETV